MQRCLAYGILLRLWYHAVMIQFFLRPDGVKMDKGLDFHCFR